MITYKMDVSRYRAQFPPKEHEEAVRKLLEGLDKELARSDLKQTPKSNMTATNQIPKTHTLTTNVNTKNTNQIINNNNNNNNYGDEDDDDDIPIQSKGKPMKMKQSRKYQHKRESSDSFEAASLTTGSSSSCVDAHRRQDNDDDNDEDLLDDTRSSLSQDFIEMSPKVSKERRNKLSSGNHREPAQKLAPKMQSKATSTISDSHSTSGAGSLAGSGTGPTSTGLLHSAAKHLIGNNQHGNGDGGDDNQNNNYETIPSRTIAVQCDLKASSVKCDGYLVESATDLASMQASSISSTRYGFYKLTPEAMEERHHQLARSTSSRHLAASRSRIESPTWIHSEHSSASHKSAMDQNDELQQENTGGSFESPPTIRKKQRAATVDSREVQQRQEFESKARSLRGREPSMASSHMATRTGPRSRLDSLPRRPKTALSYVSTSRLRNNRSNDDDDDDDDDHDHDHNHSGSSSPDRYPSGTGNRRLMRTHAVSHQVLSRPRSPVGLTANGRGPPLSTYSGGRSDSSETLAAATNVDRYRVPCNEEVLVSSSSSRRASHNHARPEASWQQVRSGKEHMLSDARPVRVVSSASGDEQPEMEVRGSLIGRNNEFKRSATISGNSNGFIPSHTMASNEITNENYSPNYGHNNKNHHHRRRRRHHHHPHPHDQQQRQDDELNQFPVDAVASGGHRASLLNANRITNEPNESRQQPVRYGSMSLSRSSNNNNTGQEQQPARTLIDRSCNNLNQVGHHKQQRTSTTTTTGVGAGSELGPPMAATLTRATSRQQISKQQPQQRQMPTNNTCCDVDSPPSDLSGGGGGGSRSRRTPGLGPQPSTIGRSTSMRQTPLLGHGANCTSHLRGPYSPAMTNYRRDDDHQHDDDDDDEGDLDDNNHRQYLERQASSKFQQQMEAASDIVESETSDSPMTRTWANPGSSMKQLANRKETNLTTGQRGNNRRNRRSHSMRDVSSADMRHRMNIDENDAVDDDLQVSHHLNQQQQQHHQHQHQHHHHQGHNIHHYQAKQFQYNWESASDEPSSIENNAHNAQQLFTRAAAAHQHQQLDYDSQHRLNESGLPETNSLVSSSSYSSAAAAAVATTGATVAAPKFYRNAPASCLGLPSTPPSSSSSSSSSAAAAAAAASGRQTLTRQQHQLTSSSSSNNLNGTSTNSGYATTGRQQSGLINSTKQQQQLSEATITGRAMSQQSLVRPTMPLSSGRRLRRQTNHGSGGSSGGGGGGGGSELGGSSLSLMSSRFLAGSRYENAHTRSPVVMYIPPANSKPGSMSDLNGGRPSTSTNTTSRRSSRSRLIKGAMTSSSQDNMRRRSSLSRHASDNESQSSMLRTLIRPKGNRSSAGGQNGAHYGSKRGSKLGRRRAGDNSNGEDEDMDGVGQLASEIDSYKFRRRYSVPKDAKINWFAKLRQRVISSK